MLCHKPETRHRKLERPKGNKIVRHDKKEHHHAGGERSTVTAMDAHLMPDV